ncbi:MAG: GAF domain-containing protein, partial [Deltaproteobacteria bacterium]|nr:GAF domain-containing protein [Deltaproteobacteria bacterium]
MSEPLDERAAPNGRLRFETLISDVSARMITCPLEEVDREIEAALERVRVHFSADQCGLLRIEQDRDRVCVTHAAYAEGLDRVSGDLNLADLYPHLYARLLEGEVVVVPRADDLPPTDRESSRRMGIRSFLDIPLRVGGGVRFILALNALHEEREWPGSSIPRVRLVGEMFVNALERRRSELLLRESEARQRVAAEASGAGFWSLD